MALIYPSSLPSVNDLAKSAKRNTGLMNRSMGRMTGMAGNVGSQGNALSNLASGIAGQYQSTFPQLIGQWSRMGQVNPDQYANRAAGDVSSSYDAARTAMNLNMTRAGVNPNSGRFAGGNRELAANEAAQKAAAMTAGRERAGSETFNRLGALAQYGAGMAGQAAGMHQGAAGVFGSAAGLYGHGANMYGQMAAADQAGAIGVANMPNADPAMHQELAQGVPQAQPPQATNSWTAGHNAPAANGGSTWAAGHQASGVTEKPDSFWSSLFDSLEGLFK